MNHRNYRRTLIGLTHDKTNPSEYLSQLYEYTNVPIIDIMDLCERDAKEMPYKIVIVDYCERTALLKILQSLTSASRQYEIVLVNVPYRLKTEELIQLGNLKGLFYQTENGQKIQVGLNQIVNGYNWLPRNVMSQLLHYYRYYFENHSLQAAVSLTARELEILKCLQTRASNMQIAENLFISELTVKSHLYQIFKKISVKNRTQAMIWANKNIVS